MTEESAGMTEESAGMTEESAGMTEKSGGSNGMTPKVHTKLGLLTGKTSCCEMGYQTERRPQAPRFRVLNLDTNAYANYTWSDNLTKGTWS